MNQTQRTYTTCTRDCPSTCGLIAEVTDGRLTGLVGARRHPLTRGRTCAKAARYIDRVYSPERILEPMIRMSNKSGTWQRIGWPEAMDTIAEKLERIVAEDGPEAILYYQGYGERTALKLLNRYFFNLLGGVTTVAGSLCGGTGQAAQNLDLGERISHDPLDHYNSEAIILWGRNPASTNISLVPIIRDVKSRGGPVILIDPVRTRSASLATRHIAPIPGRDGFLAMAAAKRIIEADAAATEFLSHRCSGGDAFMQLLAGFDFNALCRLAGVSRADALFLADVLILCRPTATLLGWGLHRHANAHVSIRAIDALAALSGNIGVAGGGVSQGFEEYGPYDPTYWGDGLNPPRRQLSMPRIGNEIEKASDPPIRMVVVTAANPACMAPDSATVARALAQTECVVYSGHFLDDTADRSHIFLPATTFLEETDVMASYGHNYVGPVNPAIAPLGNCRSEFAMFSELARRFDFSQRYCRSIEAWLHDLCAPLRHQGCRLEALQKEPFRLKAPMVPYADGRFPTASGKFEFMTDIDGSDPPPSDPDFPLTLITIAPHRYICSERTLAEHDPLPIVRVSPKTLDRFGIEANATVTLKSRVGSIAARVKMDNGVRPDCVVAERGGWIKAGHGLNRLTPACVSQVGHGTPYYDTAVALQSGFSR